MSSSIDPLAALVQQFPIHALIAVALLSVFCVWLVAFRRQKRRLEGMQTQLDQFRRDIRRLEADYGSLLARFLNLPRSSSSSTVTLDEKNLSIVPEKSETALHEKAVPQADSKGRAAD